MSETKVIEFSRRGQPARRTSRSVVDSEVVPGLECTHRLHDMDLVVDWFPPVHQPLIAADGKVLCWVTQEFKRKKGDEWLTYVEPVAAFRYPVDELLHRA